MRLSLFDAEAGRNMAPDICLLKVGKWVLAIARTPVDKVIIGNANLFMACKIVQVLLSCSLFGVD
ncbi:MAG: hypothetical protein IKJ58_00300 [Akkermansia sp.]|nr:hypothetical protein [Akkermansia sp.]